jgi:2,3-bisphosphoglycerate-dependent phosphoglycerate mutase
MQLLLVRHGEPLAARAEPGAAGADPALSERGHLQARRLAQWLGSQPERADVTEVVTSTMVRARQTAEPVRAALDLGATEVADLVEFDHGRPEYRPVHERDDADPDWQAIRAGEFPSFVDGAAFRARVDGAFHALAQRHPGRDTVLVVCHAGVINTYLTGLLGIPRPLVFPLHHTSVSRVLVSRSGGARVRSVNETQHVDDVL